MFDHNLIWRSTRISCRLLVFGMIFINAEYKSFGQDPVPADKPAEAEKPAADNPATEKPAAKDDSNLDEFDDFFGKKPKKDEAKPADQDKAEPKDDDATGFQAVPMQVAPAIRISPALRVAPAMPAAEMAEALDGADVEIDPRMNRLTRAFKLERALLRRVCTLTPEQEKTLDTWDAKWLQAQLDSDSGKKLGRKLSVIPMGMADVPFSLSRSVLLDLITPELKKLITEEQFAAYMMEVEARLAFEKQSEVDAMVAIVDHHLMLNSEQRAEVEKVVSKMGTLPQEPLNYLRYGQYIPNMSLAPILKHLNKYQRKVLQGLQQVQFGSSSEEDMDIIEQ
jgi:hypothetical protein